MTRARADALVLAAALIWGVAFYFQKIAMADIGPFLFTGLRALIAAAVLAPLVWLEHGRAETPITSLFPVAVLGGIAFTAGGVLQQTGLITATVTNTSFLTALYVVLAPFLLWLLRNERPGFRVWIASAAAFLGIWALGGGGFTAFSRGDWLVAASALFWSLYMVATTASGRAARPFGYTCASFLTVAAIALPCAALFEVNTPEAVMRAGPALLSVGILSSALTFALLSVAVRHMTGARAAILLSTETLFAAAAGYVLLGERLPVIGWVGAAILLAAILLIQTGRPKATD